MRLTPRQTIDTSGLQRLVDEAQSGARNPYETIDRFTSRFPAELAKVRRQAGMTPVRTAGRREIGLRQGFFQMPLRDGTVGYFQRRTDDCFTAVLASLLQMSPHLVPDAQRAKLTREGVDSDEISARNEEQFAAWSARYGLRVISHVSPPTWSKRWVGVVPSRSGDPWDDHVLLMSGTECLFDPAHLLPPGKDQPTALEAYTVADIEAGITIERN